jgi:hypothetical protein
MKLKLPLLFVSLAGLGIAGTAFAGDSGDMTAPPADRPAFSELDQNADGAITPDEAKDTWLAMSFTEVDSNHDGLVSQPEYEKAKG